MSIDMADQAEVEADQLDDISHIFESIGRFVVAFELLHDRMKLIAEFVVDANGLSDPTPLQIYARKLSFRGLIDCASAIVCESTKKDLDTIPLVKQLFDRIRKLDHKRNAVVHSTWFVGIGEGGKADAEGHSFRVKPKEGLSEEFERKDAEYFKELDVEAHALAKACHFLALDLGKVGKTHGFTIEHGLKEVLEPDSP